MVKEREPPKIPSISGGDGKKAQPPKPVEFGKPSPLGSMNANQRHPFVIPKTNRPRPEHHRPAPSSTLNDNASKENDKRAFNPFQATRPSSFKSRSTITIPDDDSVVEIMKPMNADRTTWRAPEPMFSSKPSAPKLGKAASTLKNFMDLTTPDVGYGSVNSSFRDEIIGSADAYSYIDSEKANENIKALLEGAFEDEDDKPRTRSRKKKIEKQVDELADKLMGVKVDEKAGNKELEDKEDEEEEEEDDGTVEGLKVKLLPHQIEGVAWMRDKESGLKKTRGVLPKGGILADDMGLGKTVQTIALLLTNPRPPVVPTDKEQKSDKGKEKKDKSKIPATVSKSTLVVAPLALIKQWEGEIESKIERSHRLSVCVYHGTGRTKHRDDLDNFDVVITTYGTLSSEHGKDSGCFGIHWYRIVLDEAHTIKNRNAKATQAVYALNSLYRWCLTGTPLQNNLDELQSLIRFLRIKPYDELAAWREQITRPMSNGRGGLALRRLQVYLKAFMKRRTKDVLKLDSKPEAENPNGEESSSDQKHGSSGGFKIVNRDIVKIEAEFSSEEWAFYQRLEQRADRSLERMIGGQNISYAGALVLLLRLRQACNHPDLVKGELAKEQDALICDDTQGKNKENDIDSIADMLGGLSMATKRCDVCQIELTKQETLGGAARCGECEEDLKTQVISTVVTEKKQKHRKSKAKARSKPKPVEAKVDRESQRARSRRARPVIIDSDDEDEDEDGEWIVPEEQRGPENLTAPVGSDGEDAEGGGEWIGSEDSETGGDDEDATDDDDEEEDEDEEGDLSESTPNAIHDVQTSAKIRHLMRILKRESGQSKFIVFSVFTSMLDKIEPFLKNGGIGYARYDGGMRNDLREASLNRLRNSSSTRVLLCSLRAGSLGLNLTAASRVVILEPFWNPFVEEQAIDRVHRLNQTVDVKVYKLTIKGTVEERILELQERKRELAKSTIEGKSAAGKLTMKDMLALFGRDAEARSWDDGKLSFTTKSSKLLDSKEMAASGHQAQTLGPHGKRGSGKRATPPVMERKASAGSKREDPIYGRRW
ncbi:ATP-dependent helicase RIS1 [Nannizzia gypsea CBS 118893]|uniref:ATP-dependent helicase RIS1 n=1 Tax=Arthroderma gypseum (strain ATCC MYA-4604 / CBS 118893) TaxID=535722 RepID=E4V4M7_ARTGP|nr:ATP-dependent helicase RIS1 [Nannizzia gypsea CBS 118893]EFR04951.1 ATP-dependent helicase RIS1 [Nannizzia gypsea CBS 118893]